MRHTYLTLIIFVYKRLPVKAKRQFVAHVLNAIVEEQIDHLEKTNGNWEGSPLNILESKVRQKLKNNGGIYG